MTSIDPKLRQAFTGISGILVTPFDDQDRIAPNRLKPIVDRAVNAGVHVLVANGNTGEFYGLTTAEAEQMVHAVAEQIGGRAPLLAGVGRSIGDACALAKASRAAGATALMVHQPPDPFVSPRGVVAYVERVAEAGGGLPLMLYLRNDGIGLDTIEALCKVQGVAGVKWASPTPLRLAEAIRRSSPDIVWVGGLAETWAPPLCAVGARGFTSGLINVWPEHSVAIHAGAGSGRLRPSQSAHRRHARLRGDPGRGAEWDQRDSGESGVAADGRGLRPDPAALGVAAHGGPDGPPAYPSRLVEVVPDRSRRDDETTSDSLAARVPGSATRSKGMGASYSALVVLAANALVAILRSVGAAGTIKRVNRK